MPPLFFPVYALIIAKAPETLPFPGLGGSSPQLREGRGDSRGLGVLAVALCGRRRGSRDLPYGDLETEGAMFEVGETPNRSRDHSAAPQRSL